MMQGYRIESLDVTETGSNPLVWCVHNPSDKLTHEEESSL